MNHVINFVTWSVNHVTSFVSWKEGRDWLTGYDVRGRVLLSWPADALKAGEPGPVRSEDL